MFYKKKIFARNLRKESTKEEKLVWDELRNRRFLNLKFRRQHVIEGFVIDFYCHELRLAIEIDGGVHDKQEEYDQIRQSLIEDEGIHFIRISNVEVNEDINTLLEMIKEVRFPPLPSNNY